MISLSEFVEKYIKDMNNVLQPYQEAMMKSFEAIKEGTEFKIFSKPSGKAEVFDYFYTHWKFNREDGNGHMIGQKCMGDSCPICQAVEAIADTEFLKREEMTI